MEGIIIKNNIKYIIIIFLIYYYDYHWSSKNLSNLGGQLKANPLPFAFSISSSIMKTTKIASQAIPYTAINKDPTI